MMVKNIFLLLSLVLFNGVEANVNVHDAQASIATLEKDNQKYSSLNLALSKIRSLEYAKVQKFIKDHKLYFVYAGFCHNCHALSPKLKKFVERFNIDVQAVSFDGKGLAEFPDYIQDIQLIRELRVMQVPAVVFRNKSTNKVVSFKYGPGSEPQLIEYLYETIDQYEFVETKEFNVLRDEGVEAISNNKNNKYNNKVTRSYLTPSYNGNKGIINANGLTDKAKSYYEHCKLAILRYIGLFKDKLSRFEKFFKTSAFGGIYISSLFKIGGCI